MFNPEKIPITSKQEPSGEKPEKGTTETIEEKKEAQKKKRAEKRKQIKEGKPEPGITLEEGKLEAAKTAEIKPEVKPKRKPKAETTPEAKTSEGKVKEGKEKVEGEGLRKTAEQELAEKEKKLRELTEEVMKMREEERKETFKLGGTGERENYKG